MELKLYFLLLLALQICKIQSGCVCYQSGNYTGKNAPLSNSYDPNNFNECYTQCSYIAYSGDDSYGWTSLTVQWGPVASSDGVLEVYEGTSTAGTKIIQVNAGENVLEGDAKYNIKSSTSSIFVKYSQTGSGANTYYGSIKAVPGLQSTPQPTTTTAVPTTVTYNNALYKNDPSLITHDLLVVVNQHTSAGLRALIKMNSIIRNFVNVLSVTQDANSSSGTRLSLSTLNPYYPYYSFQGDIWQLNNETLISSLPNSGITIPGNINEALIGLIDVAFKVNTSSLTDSRPNVQRSILLVTAEWPSTGATLNETVQKKFTDFGVNLLVVGYNLSTNTEFFNPNRWYNAVNTTQADDKLVASFVNPFYFNDKTDTNYWCPQGLVETTVSDTGVSTAFFFEPSNYAGPNGTNDNSNWLKFMPYDGQTARYCNFANNEYIYNKPAGVDKVKVTVFYELETGKDVLSFYDSDNNLVASFTGYDISGSSFYYTSPTLKATFTSDNQSVYRGFYVQITSDLS